MENQQSSYGEASPWLREDDLLYPCGVVSEDEKLYCYLLVTSRILPAVGYDWARTAEWCRRAEESFVDVCFQSFGRDASGFARQEPRKIHSICSLAGDRRTQCVFGAVRDVLNNDVGDARAANVCKLAHVADRSYCYYGIGSILGSAFPGIDDRASSCARLSPRRYVADCVRGATSVVIG